MEFSAGWKPVPSVSESNPGRSLGIYNHGENCCLEDSTSHRAKHPRQSDKSVFEKKQGGKTNTDCTDITDFIRGATWYWFYYGTHLRLYGAGCLQQEIIRGNPSARQAQLNPTTQKKIRERTDPSHRLYPWLSLNMASEPKASKHINGVLSSRQHYFYFF